MDIDGILMGYDWDMIGIQVDDAKWGPQTTATLVDNQAMQWHPSPRGTMLPLKQLQDREWNPWAWEEQHG